VAAHATASTRGRRAAVAAGRPSVVRRAITLLLNYPEASGKLDIEKLASINRPGIGLLHDLIETTQQEPNITTAGLLERWRHDDEGRHLGKLAAIEVIIEEEFDPAAELGACLDQLAIAGRRDRIDFLIEKQRVSSLTDEEKAEFRALS
jgi:DNA primase